MAYFTAICVRFLLDWLNAFPTNSANIIIVDFELLIEIATKVFILFVYIY